MKATDLEKTHKNKEKKPQQQEEDKQTSADENVNLNSEKSQDQDQKHDQDHERENDKSSNQISDYITDKPNDVESNIFGNLVPNHQSFDLSPVSQNFLSMEQYSLLKTLSSSLYVSNESSVGLKDFGLYFFNSYIKRFDGGTYMEAHNDVVVTKLERIVTHFQTRASASINISPYNNIFGNNGNDTLNGTLEDDALYGNKQAAARPFTMNHAIMNPTPEANDQFGSYVSVSGTKALTSAIWDNTGATRAGTAYLYDTTSGNLLFTLNNPTPSNGDLFGTGLGISGNYAIIGAYWDDTNAADTGSAYIYNITNGNLLFTLNNPTPAVGDGFGRNVSIDGNYAIVGAAEDDTGAAQAGSAYIYDITTGTLLYTLNNPNPTLNDYFGLNSAISGNTGLISAHLEDAGAVNSGSVYIYDMPTGNLLFTLNNPNPENNGQFGASLDIDGNHAIIGAINNDTGIVDSGAAYIYDVTTGNLLMTLTNPTAGANDRFGNSVAISGNYAVVGTTSDDVGANNAGAAYLYDINNGDLLFTFMKDTPLAGDNFGIVAIDGNQLVIGAYNDHSATANSGGIYLYQIDFSDSDILYGGAGDDLLYGLYGDDRLYGQAGADRLYGGEGADRFVFDLATAFDGIDRIEDFNLSQGDIIDISNVLSGYARGVSNVNDFVHFTVDGSNTIMSIDANGSVGGADFQDVAIIVGGASLTPTALETAALLDGVM